MKFSFFYLAPLVLLAFGCSTESKVIGEWHQEAESSNILDNMAVQGGPQARLTLGDDHKFSLRLDVVRDNPGKLGDKSTTTNGAKIEGTWEVKDQQVLFHASTVDGRPVEDVKREEQAREDELKSKPLIPEPTPAPPPKPGDTIIAGSTPVDSQKAREQLNKFASDLASALVPKTPIPASGQLSEKGGSLKVTLEDGGTMSFGKSL